MTWFEMRGNEMGARRFLMISVLSLSALLLATAALAAVQAYQLDWWTVDSGGTVSSGGDYSLSGVIGQPDAGSLSGGEYTLSGGFWSEAVSVPPERKLYLPLVSR